MNSNNFLPHGRISDLRIINVGKLVAAFKIRLPGIGWIECEYFADASGPRIDARSIKDSGGKYRRTVSLDAGLRDRICGAVASAIAKLQTARTQSPKPAASEGSASFKFERRFDQESAALEETPE